MKLPPKISYKHSISIESRIPYTIDIKIHIIYTINTKINQKLFIDISEGTCQMNITEAAEKFNKTKETVKRWCENNYMRGVKKDNKGEYIIPQNAREPYTADTRSEGDAIYTSIVKATLKQLDVTVALYKMSQSEFDTYVKQLLEIGVINEFTDEETGIVYLCKTLKSTEFSKLRKNRVKKTINELLKDVRPNINVIV